MTFATRNQPSLWSSEGGHDAASGIQSRGPTAGPQVSSYIVEGPERNRSHTDMSSVRGSDNRGNCSPIRVNIDEVLPRVPPKDNIVQQPANAVLRKPITQSLNARQTQTQANDRRVGPTEGPSYPHAFVLRTQSKSRMGDDNVHEPNRVDIRSQPSSGGALVHRRAAQKKLWSWIERLPQPEDDQSITGHVIQVFALAEQYVDNFYVDKLHQRIVLDPILTEMEFAGLPNDNSAGDVLYNVKHPTVVIKHCLVAVLLSSIAFDAESPLPSLLPPEFIALEVALKESTSPEQDHNDTFSALSAYRVLLHHLRSDVESDKRYLRSRDKAISKIEVFIETTFSPWQSPMREPKDRLPVLAALLRRTSELGILLFSQAATFIFDWQLKAPESRDFDIAIWPRMLKVYDDDAQELDFPQLMLNIRSCKTRYVEDAEVPQLPPVVPQHTAVDPESRDWIAGARVLTVEDNVVWQDPPRPHLYPTSGNNLEVDSHRLLQNQDQARREVSNLHEMPAEPQKSRYELDAGPQDFHRGVHQHVTAEQVQADQTGRNIPLLHNTPPTPQHSSENHSRSGRPHRHEVPVIRQNAMGTTSDHVSGPGSPSSQHGDRFRAHQTPNNRATRDMPPVASQHAFTQMSLSAESANAHRTRSGSLSRGRSQSTHGAQPERRASISCDRNDAAVYANRHIETFRDSPQAHQGNQDPRGLSTARQAEEPHLAQRNTNEPSGGATGDNYYENKETDDREHEQRQGRPKRKRRGLRGTLRDEDENHKGQGTTKLWGIFAKKGNSLPLS